MQKEGIWLSNEYIKIKSPLSYYNDDINSNIECYVEEYNFGLQRKKFEKLKESLEPFDILLTKVYSDNNNGTSFLVETTGPIVWSKKKSKSWSATNLLYVGKQKFKLSSWLDFTKQKRKEIINSVSTEL